MQITCSNGHNSDATDYCDVCGVAIAPNVAPPSSPATTTAAGVAPSSPSGGTTSDPTGSAAAASASPPKVGTAGICPNCASPYDGLTLFCEDCGYDFVLQAMPAPKTAPVAPSMSNAAPSGPAKWLVVVSVDRAHYDRVADTSVAFPEGVAERTVELSRAESLIGRRSTSRNINPEVDCSVAPDDVAVSRQHAKFLLADDGSLQVVDIGSSNGTRINEQPDLLPPNEPRSLANGDRVYVGAWTKLTVVDVR